MKFSDIYKKGSGAPLPTDIPTGGMAIDIENQKAYSKDAQGDIFQLGLSKQEILDMINKGMGFVPIGSVVAYAGALNKIPANWKVCDGKNGTPDLTDRFIMGTDDQSKMHRKGGSANSDLQWHSHSTTPHSHSGSTSGAGKHNHQVVLPHSGRLGHPGGNYGYVVGPKSGATQGGHYTSIAPAHSHGMSLNASAVKVNHAGGGDGKGKNIPPYVILAYIMRKA